MIRLMRESDLTRVKQIHEKYYEKHFALPDFSNFIRSFVFTNDSGKIIVAGGVRPILEVVAVTDKEAAIRDKHHTLFPLLWAAENVARETNFTQIHAFPEPNAVWRARLKKNGFYESAHPCYVKDV